MEKMERFTVEGIGCRAVGRGAGPHPLLVVMPAGEEETAMVPGLARRGLPTTPEGTALLGYSLAGLFSLWAFYEAGSFGGCACCSGSLWYDG